MRKEERPCYLCRSWQDSRGFSWFLESSRDKRDDLLFSRFSSSPQDSIWLFPPRLHVYYAWTDLSLWSTPETFLLQAFLPIPRVLCYVGSPVSHLVVVCRVPASLSCTLSKAALLWREWMNLGNLPGELVGIGLGSVIIAIEASGNIVLNGTV